MNVRRLQQDMKRLGLYTGLVDGLWGRLSETAYQALLAGTAKRVEEPAEERTGPALAWGTKVSQTFKDRIIWTANSLRMPKDGADWIMSCIAFETGESFRADIRNGAGSGATGLIQFMPATALPYFHTEAEIAKMTHTERRAKGIEATDRLAAMTPEDQINYVYRYFRPYAGRLNNLGDVYMSILWPAGIGRADEWKLWCRDTREITYMQNRGLDVNKDGCITRGEAVSKVRAKLVRGRTYFYG